MAPPVNIPGGDDKSTAASPGPRAMLRADVPQALHGDATTVPGEAEEVAQTVARKSTMKRAASKSKQRGDPRNDTTEASGVAERAKTSSVICAKTEEGQEVFGATTKTKKHYRAKAEKSSKGKKEGDKSPEESKRDFSPTRDDRTDKTNLSEAPATESAALALVPVEEATAEGPIYEAPAICAPAVGLPAVEVPAVGAPTVQAPAIEAPADGAHAVGAPVEANAEPSDKPKAQERINRRKSKVAIMDDNTEDASYENRRQARRASHYSRKDSLASTRRMDNTWRSVASSASAKILYRTLHPLERWDRSALDAEEERLLASFGCAFLLAFVVIFAGIAYFISRGRGSAGGILCDTPECLSARQYLAGLLRLGDDTCSGFYRYVCGSWIGGNSSFAKEVSEAFALKLHHGLIGANLERDRRGRHVAAETYRACHKYVHFKTTLEEVVRLGRRMMGTKHVLRADSFPELIEATLRVSLTFGISTAAISLNFVNVSGLAVVHISAGKCLMSKLARVVEKDLGPFLTRILKSLPETDVSKTVERLAKLDAELCQLVNMQNSTESTEELRAFLDNLLLDMKAEDWIFAINRVLPSTLQVRPEQSAVVTGTDSVKQCFDLIVNSGLRTAATYLATSLEAEVASIESEKQLAENYDELTIRFCLGLSQRTVTMTWQSIVAEFVAKAEDSAAVVHGIFRKLQSKMSYSSTSFWLRDGNRERAMKVFQGTSLAIGIYDSATGGSAADYSSFLPSFGAARIFIARFLETLRHNQEVRFRTPPTRAELVLESVDPFGDVDYVSSLKAVLLPEVFLTEPYLYSTGVPLYFNYGTVGSLLAFGLSKAVMDSQGGETDRLGSSAHLRRLERNVTLACLRRLHNKLGFKGNVSGTLEEQDDAMYALAQSALLAHASLAEDLKASAADQEEYELVWPEAQTTFFLRFCLWSCSGIQDPSPLSPMERCLLPLHNMPAFATTFGCDNREDFFKSHCSF